MTVLILGVKGMLGHALGDVFADYADIFLWDRKELDITDREAVKRAFTRIRPQVVINAAAFTDVDGAESRRDTANRVNGIAVGFLAKACKENGSVLVHYSTDYVFDGENPEGYDERASARNPVNTYGASKLLGEQEMQRIGGKEAAFYLFRTSWLFGPFGKNFVDTMLALARENDELRVVNDQYGKPTYTLDLASTTREVLEARERYRPGIYHVTNETPDAGITWYDFAKTIFHEAGIVTNVAPCMSSTFPCPAKRPVYSMLRNTKLPPRRSWQEAVKEYLATYARKR